jgi:hypothetical protein
VLVCSYESVLLSLIKPIANVKSPNVKIAMPIYKITMSAVGSLICLPMAAAKNPKLMAMAAMGNDSRVIHFQFTDNEE